MSDEQVDVFAHVRRHYTELEKAKAYWQLQANSNNLKRTARELQIPVPTLRAWRKKWDQDGPPAVLPQEKDPLDPENFDFVEAGKKLRYQVMRRIADQLQHSQSIDHLTKLLATLNRDLDRMENRPNPGGNVNINVRLPSADEAKELLGDLVKNTISDTQERGEIIDATVVETPELDSTSVEED